MRSVLGSRASIGGVLGSGRGAAAAWWLSGGVSAANAIAVYQPIGAASLAASYTNLANPGTYNAAPGVAPTWSAATGWTFNGTTQFLQSGVVIGSAYSILVRFNGASANGTPYGFYSPTKADSYVVPTAPSGRLYRWGKSYPTAAGASVSSGVMGQAGGQGYLNGVFDGSLLAWIGTTPEQLYIGALNNHASGSATNFIASDISAIAIYNTTLSAAQVAAISSAMSALTG